ncbi:hypothetical protein FKM82_031006 [Ascaphus truei]
MSKAVFRPVKTSHMVPEVHIPVVVTQLLLRCVDTTHHFTGGMYPHYSPVLCEGENATIYPALGHLKMAVQLKPGSLSPMLYRALLSAVPVTNALWYSGSTSCSNPFSPDTKLLYQLWLIGRLLLVSLSGDPCDVRGPVGDLTRG